MTAAGGAAQYTCARCMRPVGDRAPSSACACGETLRLRVEIDSYALPGRSSLRYDPGKNWAAKYLQCTWNLRQLHTIYREDADEDELRSSIERTLASCWELADWLVAGSEPRQITQGAIDRLTRGDPLCVCRAFNGAGAAVAGIVPTRIRGSVRAWVEYREPDKAPRRFDALNLADRCIAAWDAFLRDNGVPLPTWAP